MGLWKAGEFFKFEALAKVPVLRADPDHLPAVYPTSRLLRALIFSHRIADCKKIHETQVPAVDSFALLPFVVPWVTSRRKLIPFALAFFFMGTAFWGAERFFPKTQVGYIAVMDGQERQLVVGVKKGLVRVEDQLGYFRDLTPDEFNNVPKKVLILPQRNRFVTFFIPFYFALGLIALGFWVIRRVRENRLLSMIARKERM